MMEVREIPTHPQEEVNLPRGCRLAALLFSCFLINLCLCGTLDCFGLIFNQIHKRSRKPKVQLAIVPALLFSLPFILAPIANWVIHRIGAPASLAASALLSSCGLFFSGVEVIPLNAVVPLLGCITGSGVSLGFLLVDNIISRAVAPARQDVYNSFVQAGGALGIVCLSHLSEYVGSVADVMSLYLFGTFQLSLLTTIPAFCGLDLKMQLGENLFALGNRSNLPLKRRKSLENLEKSDLLTPQPSRWQNFISHVRLTGRYLCFSPFTAFLAFRFIFSLFGDSLLLYYPTAMGKDSSLALVAFGLGRLFGLLVFTFLSPRKDFGHTSILCGVACFLGGAALCSLHPNQSQIALMAVGPIWGFWSSATLTLEVNMLRRIMRCHYNDTLHILYLANGFGTFLGPFLGLNFEAIYGGYRELFLASGLGIIFAGCLSFLVAFLLAKVGPFHT